MHVNGELLRTLCRGIEQGRPTSSSTGPHRSMMIPLSPRQRPCCCSNESGPNPGCKETFEKKEEKWNRIPVPTGECHHDVQGSESHHEVEEGVRVGHALLLVVPRAIALLATACARFCVI